MILLADGGSTKCDWAVIDEKSGRTALRFATEGLNPFVKGRDEIASVLRSVVVPRVKPLSPEAVFFYGAGAAFAGAEVLCGEIAAALPGSRVEVRSDMDGAARSAVGDGRGIVCILGTGSNSAYYENGRVVRNTPSLGYVLGDEGGGAALGRALLSDIFKGVAPEHIRRDFERQFGLSQAELLENVYRKPAANRFLASFAPFLSERLDDSYVCGLVSEAFESFILRNMAAYPSDAPVWFVGSVALHFERVLRPAVRRCGFTVGGVAGSPLEGLVAYHTAKAAGDDERSAPEGADAVSDAPVFRKITEEPSYYDNLERMTVHDILAAMNREDSHVPRAVARALPQIEAFVEALSERMLRGGRLFYIGAGTSGRLGVLDASEIPPTFGMPPTVVIGLIAGGDRALRCPVEGAEDDEEQGWRDILAHEPTPEDTVVGIASSGTTPYVVGALRRAREFGMLTASVSSNPSSPLAAEADFPIETVVGAEFVTGSSRMKSGTAQKLVCNMISTAAMIRLGRVQGNRMVNMQLSNRKLVDRGTRMIVDQTGMPYERARRLLLLHGSVRRALDAICEGKE